MSSFVLRIISLLPTPEEIDGLANAFTELLDGKITEPKKLQMTEPDFVFVLYPIKDLRTGSKYIYVAPGHEFQDVYDEWRIYFWDEGLTNNFLAVTLYRNDIVALREFFDSVRKR